MASGTRGKLHLMVPNEELLADTRTKVFEFNPFRLAAEQVQPDPKPLGVDKGNGRGYAYAPGPAETSEKAYYLEVLSEDIDKLFQDRFRPIGTTIFVSVSLVKDLIDGQDQDWLEECAQVSAFPTTARFLANSGNRDNFEIILNEEAEKTWLLNTKPSSAQEASLTLRTVWVRDKHGALEKEKLKVETNGSAAALWQRWIKKKFSMKGMGGKPPRCTNFNLMEPLCIVPITSNSYIKSALEDCVDLVNQENDPEDKSNKGTLANGRLVYSNLAPHPSNYMLMSVDPFGIFTTYIHVGDWDAWMTHVGHKDHTKPNSMRDFIFRGNATMDKCFDGITEEYEKLYQNQSSWMALTDPNTAPRNQKARVLSKRFHTHFSPRGKIDARENGVGMSVYLEAQKMLDAVNKRAGEDTQKTVMGNVSAPEVADSLNWAKEMVTFTNAEWLHLSGFAYGGFLMTGDTSGWSTSQNPHNLVFGTSETNSLMTRYESAWQTWLFYEYELQKMSNIIQLVDAKQRNPRKMPFILSADGQLVIRTNVREVDLEYDHYDAGAQPRYTRKKFPLWHKEKAEAQRADFKQAPGAHLSDTDMRQATEDYFFIAHTIEYSLIYEHVSHMLKRPAFQQTVYFYPFSRPLLHKLETELDRKLMSHLYKATKRDLVEDWKALGPITAPSRRGPYTKKNGKTAGTKLRQKKRQKAVAGRKRKQANSEPEVPYFDFEGYGDFADLIVDLDLGELGDFESFEDMTMITDFGKWGPGEVEEDDLEEDITDRVSGDPTKTFIFEGSLYKQIEGYNAKGKKDQEREMGDFSGFWKGF
ncbi:hypothetical protein ACHAPT_005413 [Fusarium lateritium]